MSKAGMARAATWLLFAAVAAAVAGSAVLVSQTTSRGAQAAPPAGSILMHGSQPLVPPPRLVISGDVVALAAGDTLLGVDLRIGTEVMPVQIQGNTFSATVFLTDVGRMASLEARSTHGRQSSHLGTLSRLAVLAASDGRLDMREHPALRVSTFTTALARHVEYGLGRLPTTDQELNETTRAVGHDGIEVVAHALAAIAQGARPLPAGYADGYGLLADRSAFKAWQEQTAGGGSSAGYLFQNAPGVPLAALTELPGRLLFLGGISVSQLPIYSSHVRLLERLPDGSVNFHEELAVREPHYSMALNGAGEVVLTPRGAATRMYERYMPDNDVVRRKAVGHVLRRLGRAGGVSLWALKSDWSDQDIDSPSTPPVSVTEYRVLSSTDLSLWMRPDGWTPTQHNYAHPLFCNEPGVLLGPRLAQCGYVQQRYLTNVVSGPNAHTVQEGYALNNQGAAAVPGGENYFNFMLDIGRSRLTINNGETETHFWRLAPGGTSAVPAVFLTRSLQGEYAGETMVGLTLSLLYNPNGFPTPEPLGSWQNGYSQAQAPSYVGPDIAVRLSRYADGSSPYTISTDGTDTLQQQSWTMVGHGIFNAFARASFPDGSVRDVGECAQAVAQGATSCTSLIRYFRPLANTRRSYYGIEEQYQVTYPDVAFPPPGQPLRYRVTRMMSRPGYQSCEAGACLPLFDYVIAQAAVSASTPAGVAGWLDRRSTVRTSRAARFIMPLRSQARSTPVQHEDENLFALDHGRQPDDDCRACSAQVGGVPPRASSRAEHDGSAGEPPLDVGGDHDEGPRGDSAPIGTPPFKQVGVPAKVESKPATPSSSS